LNQNVGGCSATSPPGDANRLGKYDGSDLALSGASPDPVESMLCAGDALKTFPGAVPDPAGLVCCSSDVLVCLGDAVSLGSSSMTVTTPNATIKAVTLIVVSRRLLLR
jgi:hypothetical protein